MPNWCEGTLKVRGKVKDLKRFVLEGLRPVGYMGEIKEPLALNEYGDVYSKETYHIENTYRGFVEGIDIYFSDMDREKEIICLDTKFAWGIDAEQLREICIKYNVDMRIYAFERGMEFNQDIEIVDGVIKSDRKIEFKNYEWECVMPTMGG